MTVAAGEPEEEAQPGTKMTTKADVPGGLLYTVEDTPPLGLAVLLGFQHYLTAVGAMIAVPLVLYEYFCMDEDTVGVGELISTIFFVSGVATLLQTTIGVRLPIVQGGTYAFVTPTIAILTQPKWACPYREIRLAGGTSANFSEAGLPDIGSDEHREMWMTRIREIQGAIIVASAFQVVLGFTGIMGLALRYIGPLSIAPPITLVGLSLFSSGAVMASSHTWIALTTMVLTIIFSQYLKNVHVPMPAVARWCTLGVKRVSVCGLFHVPVPIITRRCRFKLVRLPLFTLFPVLLAIAVAWLICYILTVTDVLPGDPSAWGHKARTDINLGVMTKSQWFRVPYPGQWGMPTVSVPSVFGLLAGVLCGVAESLGDYYAGARISGAPPPPIYAVNRGIGMEGVACMLAGAWGSGNGTTSYSENIGAIGITKVGSRRVVQVGAAIMLILGSFGKFGALFATIPAPIVGGMFMVTFGMVTAVGLSNLQFVDMNSSRNICIVGISLSAGLCVPAWINEDANSINTGNDIVDQIISVLLGTSMFVGGLTGLVLDNTIPGTEAERGIVKWQTVSSLGITEDDSAARRRTYDIHVLQKYLDKIRLVSYLPFCPNVRTRSGKPVADNVAENTGKTKCEYKGVKIEIENTDM